MPPASRPARPQLRARRPTGQIPWPLTMVAGAEKSGKTTVAYELLNSPHVAGGFVIDLGEGNADAMTYVAGEDRYMILEHNGTFPSIEEQVAAACAERSPDGRPYVVIIDNVSDLWDGLKDSVDRAARSTEAAQRILAEDPDADIKAGFDRWNVAKGRWGRIMSSMRLNPVIGVVIVRADIVTVVEDGRPVIDKRTRKPMKTVSYKCEKGLPFVCGMIVETVRDEDGYHASLLGAWAPGLRIPAGGLKLRTGDDREVGGPLAEAFFGFVLNSGERAAGQAKVVSMDVGTTTIDAKTWAMGQVATALGVPQSAARERAARIWHAWATMEYGEQYRTEHPQADDATVAREVERAITPPAPGRSARWPGDRLSDEQLGSLRAFVAADLGEPDPFADSRPVDAGADERAAEAARDAAEAEAAASEPHPLQREPEPRQPHPADTRPLEQQEADAAPRTCPECHGPHHLGACPPPPEPEPEPRQRRARGAAAAEAAARDAELSAAAGVPTLAENSATRRAAIGSRAMVTTADPTAAPDPAPDPDPDPEPGDPGDAAHVAATAAITGRSAADVAATFGVPLGSALFAAGEAPTPAVEG